MSILEEALHLGSIVLKSGDVLNVLKDEMGNAAKLRALVNSGNVHFSSLFEAETEVKKIIADLASVDVGSIPHASDILTLAGKVISCVDSIRNIFDPIIAPGAATPPAVVPDIQAPA